MNNNTIFTKHTLSGSCFCSAFSNVFNYHGYRYDDAMIFGLSSSIYWGFLGLLETRDYNIIVNYSNMFLSLMANTGLKYKMITSNNETDDLNLVIKMTEQSGPVALKLHPSLFVPSHGEVAGFLSFSPAHWVTVVGYDRKKQILYYYDNRSFDLKNISFEEFMQGRNKGKGEQNPHRSLYVINFKDELFPFEVSVKTSLALTVNLNCYINRLLYVRSSQQGFDRYKSVMNMITKLLSPVEIENSFLKMKISITGGYSIKGCYRLLFVRYLEHLNKYFNNQIIESATEDFKESAFLWNQLITLIDPVIKSSEIVTPNFTKKLLTTSIDIFNLEQRGFKKIEKWVY